MQRQHPSQTKNAIAPPQPENAIARSSIHPIAELQSAIGNQAVNKLLANQPIVQAKPMFRGLSHELVIQPKLTIGAAGDKYEQEADRISQQVVDRIHTPQSQSVQRQETSEPEDKLMMKPIVQRQSSSEASGNIAPELETSIQQEKGSGQPLAENIRQPMEKAFATDFSSVKVHTDTQSDQLNQSIQAKAFTTGQNIFFRHGEYNPESHGGKELLAHELTHVVQQETANIGGKCQIHRKIYHTFKINDQDQAVWDGSAEEFYRVLSEWLEENTDKVSEEMKEKWGNRKKKIIETIKEMMAKGKKRAVVKEGLHLSTALRRQKHVFDDEENAIRKILAEEYRDESTKKEEKLAKEVMNNSVIVKHLKSVASKITQWDFYKSYKEQVKGEYGFYMRSNYALYKKVRVDEILSTSNDLTKLISAIHDVTSFLYNFGDKKINQLEKEIKNKKLSVELRKRKREELKELKEKKKEVQKTVNTPDEKSTSTYNYNESVDPKDWETEEIKKVRPSLFESVFGKKEKVKSYIEEKSKVMKKVRENKMLVEVGPSYTTGRLMQLCETLKCSDQEKIAVALAIFAFWNRDYWKSTSGIHRFHFVMDMCKNYVPSLEYKIAYPENIKDLAPFLEPNKEDVAWQ
jgi:Domain of unknown function (DUF4157)